MINLFCLALTHGLIAVALWRLLFRPELDNDGAAAPPARKPWVKAPPAPQGQGDA